MGRVGDFQLQGGWQRRVILSVVLSIVAYAVWIFYSDADQVVVALQGMSWWQLALIFSLSLLNYFFRFLRWHAYLIHFSHHVPWHKSLAYYLAGFALTTTPGKAGEAIRSFYLHRHGVRYATSFAALFSERILDLLVMVLLSTLVLIFFPDYRWIFLVVAFVVLFFMLGLRSTGWLHRLYARKKARLSERVCRLAGHLLQMLDLAGGLMRGRMLVMSVLLGLLAWGAEGLAFALLIGFVGGAIGIAAGVSIYSASVLVGALSFVPGGLGGTEAVMEILLTASGISAASAVAAILLCRLATLWFAVVIGGVVMGYLTLKGSNDGEDTYAKR